MRRGDAVGLDPKEYWSERLIERWNCSGMLGHGDYSANYNCWLYRAKERALRKVLRRLAVPVEGRRVLDVGTGMGFWLRWYLARGAAEVVGLDISDAAVQRLREAMPGTTVLQADVTDAIPVRGAFDLVNVFDVFYHIRDDEAFRRGLRNSARRVRPGGWLIATDLFDRDRPFQTGRGSWRSLASYVDVLADEGFGVKVVQRMCYLLNGMLFDRLVHPQRLRVAARRLEEVAAPLFYWLDGIHTFARPANLRLLAAQKDCRAQP